MFNKYYRQLTLEEQNFVITRLIRHIETTQEIMRAVLEDMNPSLEIEGIRIVMHKNSYERLRKKIREYSA